MFKKIFVSVILLSFLNYLFGCYVTDEISRDKLYTTEEKITEVVFPDGNVVKFDRNGAEYKILETVIIGISEDGNEIFIPLEEVRELRTEKLPSVSIEQIGNKKISEILLQKNFIYKFDSAGGSYDSENEVVKGNIENGKFIKIKIESIKKVYTESPVVISKDELDQKSELVVFQLVKERKYELISFDENGADFIYMIPIITGVTEQGELVFIKASEILYVNVSTYSEILTTLLVTGLVVGILAVVVAVAAGEKKTINIDPKKPIVSCPFIYSFNLDKYVLDAQPLGGAITKGLQRTDLSKLDFLSDDEGKFKILVRNEMPETQYIDELGLFIVDHPEDSDVITDLDGGIHIVNDTQEPVYARSESGTDLLPFVSKIDNVFWQTKLPVTTHLHDTTLRHQLTFAFPKPKGKKRAKLLFNGGTALWGSNMIGEMLDLYGDKIDSWYEQVDNLSGKEIEKEQMMQFVVREELYYLNIRVKEGDNWSPQGLIFGGGPFVYETHSYDLDLSKVTGDSLIIQLTPPYGFWSINYLAVDYEDNIKPKVSELSLSDVVDHKGNNILNVVSAADDDYAVLSEIGDYFIAEFNSVPKIEGMERTFFVKTNGYYKIHLSKDHPMHTQTLYDIVNNPGKVVEYSMNLFNQLNYTAR